MKLFKRKQKEAITYLEHKEKMEYLKELYSELELLRCDVKLVKASGKELPEKIYKELHLIRKKLESV